MTASVAVSFALFGAAIGSFLNVVIHRVPRGQSIVRPGSACPVCSTPISGADNIPLLSYVLLRGKCRTCAAPISPRYPLIEALNTVLWVACALRFDDVEAAAFVAALASVLLALTVIDIEHRRLPNSIVLPSIAVAALWVGVRAVIDGDLDMLARALACGAAYFALLFLIAFVSGGMGFGDVKLAAVLGIATGRFGWEVTILAVFAAFFIGGFISIAMLVMRRVGRKDALPFGPSLAAGGLLAVFAGAGPVRAWLGI